MAASVMMWIACLVIATEAGPCKDKQHCSDCNITTKHCLTECDTGYYDAHCKSTCSKNCRNNTCVTSSYGSANCTEGCVPGYHGRGCNIPCDSPGGNCTACPGGCDGGYCQLGLSCVSGCVDSHYGTDCDGVTVGVSGAAISFLVMVFLVVCCKYRQRFSQKSVTKTEDVVCDSVDETGDAPVEELEWYSEIPLNDMAMPCGSHDGNYGSGDAAGGGTDDVYDVADAGRRELAAVCDNIYSKISRA